MQLRLTLLFCGLMLCLSEPLWAQQPVPDFSVWLEQVDNEQDRQLLGEQFYQLTQRPLDINNATEEELLNVPGFTPFFVRNFLLYRHRHGILTSVYELKEIPSAPLELLPLLEPYLRVSSEQPLRDTIPNSSFNITAGVPTTTPTAQALGMRWIFSSVRKLGWTTYILGEKDRQEPWLPIRNGGFDHLSVGLQYTSQKVLHKVMAGDMRIAVGQGLLYGMGTSYFSRIESSVPTTLPVGGQLRLHRSMNEVGFFRGLGTVLNFTPNQQEKQVTLSLFGGYIPLDAKVEADTIRTLYTSGLHRTATEQKYRHTANATLLGGYFSYTTPVWHTGVATQLLSYGPTPWGSKKYPIPHKYGGEKVGNFRISSDIAYTGEQAELQAELLMTPAKLSSWATLLRGAYHTEEQGSVSAGVRYLSPTATTMLSAPDVHYSNGQNEVGAYVNWDTALANHIPIRIYIDYFKGIRPDARRSAQQGVVGLLNVHYQNLLLRYKVRSYKGHKAHHAWYLMYQPHTNTANNSLRLTARISTHGTSRPSFTLGGAFQQMLTHNFFLRGVLQYFSVPKGGSAMTPLTTFMPYQYRSPLLRGSGLQLLLQGNYDIRDNLRLSAQGQVPLYQEKPNTPQHPLLQCALSARF